MKKVNKILFLIFSFLCVFGSVKALESSMFYTMNPGADILFMSSTDYDGISCDDSTLSVFKIYKDNGGSYHVNIRTDVQLENKGSETLVCTYTNSIVHSEVGGASSLSFPGKITFTFTYEDPGTEYSIAASLFKGTPASSINFASDGEFFELGKIESAEINSGAEYINMNCSVGSTSSCIFSMKEELSYDEQKVVEATIKYIDLDNATRIAHIKLTLNYAIKVAAYVGDYINQNVCTFGEGWEAVNGSYQYTYTTGSITLPSCKAPDGSMLEFHGWVYHNDESDTNLMSSGICASYPSVAGGQSFTLSDTNNSNMFFLCYKWKSGILLDLSNVNVSIGSDWISQGNDKYFVPFEGTFDLPNATLKNSANQFKGWRKNGTDIPLSPGTSVSPGGSYSAIEEKIQTVVYDYRNVVVGQNDIIKYSNKDITTCSSADTSKITTTLLGKECQIHGVKATGENEVVDVVLVVDGETIPIKYKVLATSDGTSESNSSDFVIKFDYGIDENYGDDENSSNGGGTGSSGGGDGVGDANSKVSINANGMCEEYGVSIGTESDDYVLYGDGYIARYVPTQDVADEYMKNSGLTNPNGYKMSGYGEGYIATRHYEATSKCDESKKYVAFCLESYSSAPASLASSTDYIVDETGSSTQALYKAIQFSYKNYLSSENADVSVITTKRKATMIALRLIEILEGGYKDNLKDSHLLNTSAPFLSFLQYYGLAQSVKANPVSGYDLWENWHSDELKNIVKAIMNEYLAGFPSLEENSEDAKFEVESLARQKLPSQGDMDTIRVDAVLLLPKDAYSTPDRIKAIEVSVKGHEDLKFTDLNEWNHDEKTEISFKITYNKKNAKLLKEKGNITLDVKFITDTMEFSAAVLRAKGNTEHQKMLIYDPNPDAGASVDIYFEDGACVLEDYPTDPAKFSDEDVENFREEDCCDLIKDVGSDLYKALCQNTCSMTDFNIMCELPTATGIAEQSDYNVYSIYEAVDYNFKDKYQACVVDVNKSAQARANTDTLTDVRGNELSLEAFRNNQYCRVSCKEDWNLATASFQNFTGANARQAGSYFQIDNDVFIGGSRTCVTTFLDYNKYKNQVSDLSNKMSNDWNIYAKVSTIKNILIKSGTKEEKEYKTLVATGETRTNCVANFSTSLAQEDKDAITSLLTANSYSYISDGEYRRTNASCDEDWTDEEEETLSEVSFGTQTEEYYKVETKTCNVYSVTTAVTDKVPSADGIRKYEEYPNVSKPSSDPTIKTYINPVVSNKTEFDAGSVSDSSAGWYTSAPTNDSVCGSSAYDLMGDEAAYKALAENATTSYGKVATVIEEKGKSVNDYATELNTKAADMAMCQNFYLENVSESDTNTFNSKKNGETNTVLGKDKAYGTGYKYKVDEKKESKIQSETAEYKVIETKFEPEVKYQYEEAEYMTLIGKHNYLISNDEKNNMFMGITTDSTNSKDNQKLNECVEVAHMKDQYGQTMKLCKNKINTYSYQYTLNDNKDIYTKDSGVPYVDSNNGNIGNEVKIYNIEVCQVDNGVEYNYSSNPDTKTTCAKAELYYYDVNYVKQTLANSSFYKNWGNWYVNNVTDVKIHAENEKEAIKLANIKGVAGATSGYLSTIGDYNIFPIKITTRANMYRYLYDFDKIGYFNKTISYTNPSTNQTEERDLGRVMGTNISIVLNHNHTCFYEVYEELCTCCGDPITTVVTSPYGFDTDTELSGYCGVSGCANSDNETVGDGAFDFYNSSVSLYDLDAIGDNDPSANLGDNWNKDDKFIYNGDSYTTSKGHGLANDIQDRGESIYEDKPEYSYYLDPTALGMIRNYNDNNDYVISTSTLRPVGKTAMSSTNSSDFDLSKDEEGIIVGHYASVFLEQTLNDYVNEDYRDFILTSREKICEVIVENNTDSAYKQAANSAYKKVQSGECRWVDYVQKYNDTYIRLAFK